MITLEKREYLPAINRYGEFRKAIDDFIKLNCECVEVFDSTRNPILLANNLRAIIRRYNYRVVCTKVNDHVYLTKI